MADTKPASEASGVGEAPWPVLSRPDSTPPEHPVEGGGWGRSGVLRVAALVGLLALVTAVGIAIGRAVQPTHHTVVTTVAATTPRAVRPRPVVHKVTLKWGPLTVRPYGKMPTGPPNAVAAVVGPTLAVVGGTGSGLVLAGPIGGKLVPVAFLSRPRASAQAFAAGGKLYVLGGEQGGKSSNSLVRIDLHTRKGRTVSTFVEPLAEAGVATRGAAVYLAGGWTGTKYATAILRLTPPHAQSSLVARLPQGVRSPAVALLGHKLYVAGGLTEHGLSNKVYVVDLDSGAVVTLGTLPRPVSGALLVPSGGRLYLLGGTGPGGKGSAAVVRIDPAGRHPAAVGRMPKPLTGAAAVPSAKGTLVVDPRAGAVYRVG
jgi:hypothetical protein